MLLMILLLLELVVWLLLLLMLAAAVIQVLLPFFQNHSTGKVMVLCVYAVQKHKIPCQKYSKSSKKHTK